MILRNQTRRHFPERKIRRAISIFLKEFSLAGSDLDITFVGDKAMQRLNSKFRGKNKTTDVLSFPLHEARVARKQKVFLGDLVISLPTCAKQAKEHKKSFEKELLFLIIHGFLHLLGYDHEKSVKEEKLMQKWERRLENLL